MHADRTGWLCLAVLAALIVPASASAATDLQIADAAWGPHATCAGRVQVAFDHAVAGRDEANEVGYATGIEAQPDGSWILRSCVITLDPAWYAQATAEQRCEVIVHEVGHLAGHRHEEGGVMSSPPGPFVPCMRLTLRGRIVLALAARSPAGSSVQCSRWQGRVLPCRVTLYRRVSAVEADESGSVRYRVRTRDGRFAIGRVPR
jgi:hypothetical protein